MHEVYAVGERGSSANKINYSYMTLIGVHELHYYVCVK